MMIEKIKNFITKLQSSDDSTKKRWLIILSVVAMIFIVAVWALYLNATIASVDSPSLPRNKTVASDNGPNLWQILAAGLKIVGGELKNGLGKLGSNNILTIQGDDRNFILDDLENTEKVILP